MSCGRGNKISRAAALLFPTSAWNRIPDRLLEEKEGEKKSHQIAEKTLVLRALREGGRSLEGLESLGSAELESPSRAAL